MSEYEPEEVNPKATDKEPRDIQQEKSLPFIALRLMPANAQAFRPFSLGSKAQIRMMMLPARMKLQRMLEQIGMENKHESGCTDTTCELNCGAKWMRDQSNLLYWEMVLFTLGATIDQVKASMYNVDKFFADSREFLNRLDAKHYEAAIVEVSKQMDEAEAANSYQVEKDGQDDDPK